ncbi:hypothetical protein R1flu_013102 [Riccia fluitans]|uniref:Uncharacterized protein n=1 Tax=Riccia fluitans TaxID=41844 RepID=A0ABD1ZDJ4_9MARC
MTSEARELTPEAILPASPERPPAEFQTPEGQATAMETDTPTMTLVERHQRDWLRADLDSSRQELEVARPDTVGRRTREEQQAARTGPGSREGDTSHEAPSAPPAILAWGTSRIGILRRSVGEFPALTPGVLRIGE